MSKQASRVGVRNDQVDIYGRINTRLPLIDDLASFLPYHTELNVYKDGTEQLLPVNTSEPTTSPILADIRYPTGIWRNKQYFTYRESPTEATGKARIKSIKGNTLVWNQLIQNGDFSDDTTGWASAKGTSTVSGNVLTYAVTEVGTGSNQNFVRQNQAIIGSHKYLISFDAKVSKANMQLSASRGSSSNYFVRATITSADTWQHIENIGVADSNGSNLYIRYQNVTDIGEIGDTFSIRNVNFFDITQNENITSVDYFRSLFNLPFYAYNSGSLLNLNGGGIKTTGKNLVFKTIEGAYISSDGQILTGTANDMVVAQVMQGQTYSFTFSTAGTSTFVGFFYTEPSMNSYDYNGIRETYFTGQFVAPITGYVAIRVQKDATNIMVNSGSTLLPYEPYTSSTLSLPISTYFPTGMKDIDNGRVYDELNDKAITRIGSIVVDGSQTYSYSASETGNWVTINLSPNGGKIDNANVQLKCSDKFTPISFNQRTYTVLLSVFRCYLNDSGNLVLRLPAGDTTFTSSTEAKTYFTSNPVTINYELATYTEVSTLDLE